ncbi:Glycosyltransferase [Heracleum sosnowskyi]|uniref:Glycosyltransferase n=1 Tax=Heracleum sosnowskyi TaxID=360622 RepID=A0AAD8HC21_9APIA|nr:Glycosyltransferase [Heracleum sosnowskyi]
MEKPAHIAIFPTPGMGHLIPLVQFAKRLAGLHKITATFIVPTDGPISKAQQTFLDSLSDGLDYVVLPPVNLDDLPNDVMIETRMSIQILRSLPSLRDTFKSIHATKKLASFVIDLFATDALDVAIEFKVAPYIFFPSTAMGLSLLFHLPKLDETTSCEYRDLPDLVQIPGCIPVHGRDLLDPVQDRKNDAYKWLLYHAKRYSLAEGIMVNSFMDLEGGAIRALQEMGSPPVYAVGPLIQMDHSSTSAEGLDCLKWLDDQPSGSVLFISFGSGGTLTSNQITELALGLEMSGQRFIWVIRSPNDEIANAAFFESYSKKNPTDFLPQGFIERTKGRGLVVPNWAPQAQILSHGSTGGFMTHCGWNSTLETMVNGVPIIAWPLYAEQKTNAVMLTEDLKVALRPHVGENNLVGRVEIAKVVKGLMEGEEGKCIGSRMRDLKDAAAKVLSEDGSSTKAMAQVVSKWCT